MSTPLTSPVLRVVVMGVSGTGKTTIGRAIALALNMPFLDADDLHSAESVRKMAAGMPLDDEDRWPWLDRVAQAVHTPPAGIVVACSALKRAYRDRLRAPGGDPIFLHLAADSSRIAERMQARTEHFMRASLLGSQVSILEPLWPDERGTTLDAEHPVDAVTLSALATLGGLGPVR